MRKVQAASARRQKPPVKRAALTNGRTILPAEKKKSPRFFCDGCGREVDASDERCPSCGKFFASIRCPKCGFTGDQGVFLSGCPVCGYSAPKDGQDYKNKKTGLGQTERGFAGGEVSSANAPLPQWLYILVCALVILTLTILLFHVMR